MQGDVQTAGRRRRRRRRRRGAGRRCASLYATVLWIDD